MKLNNVLIFRTKMKEVSMKINLKEVCIDNCGTIKLSQLEII